MLKATRTSLFTAIFAAALALTTALPDEADAFALRLTDMRKGDGADGRHDAWTSGDWTSRWNTKDKQGSGHGASSKKTSPFDLVRGDTPPGWDEDKDRGRKRAHKNDMDDDGRKADRSEPRSKDLRKLGLDDDDREFENTHARTKSRDEKRQRKDHSAIGRYVSDTLDDKHDGKDGRGAGHKAKKRKGETPFHPIGTGPDGHKRPIDRTSAVSTAEVPIPAALPMLLAAVGGLGFVSVFGRRQI